MKVNNNFDFIEDKICIGNKNNLIIILVRSAFAIFAVETN